MFTRSSYPLGLTGVYYDLNIPISHSEQLYLENIDKAV